MDLEKPNRPGMDRGSLLAGVAIVVAVVAVMAFFLANSSRRDSPQVAGNVPSPLTPEVFNAMTDDLEEHTGSTKVFSAVIFPEHAVVEVPIDNHSERYESFVWQGGFTDFSKGTTEARRFDLRQVDPKALQTLLAKAESRLDLIDNRMVRIAGAEYGNPYPRIVASVNNDYGENASVTARLDGTVIERGQ